MKRIVMPPLRQYEIPDLPAMALPIPPEKDEYAVPAEHPSSDDLRSQPRVIIMSPLRPDEMPESAESILTARPDRVLDEPAWGTAKRAPEITIGTKKLLHPWDD